MTKIESAAPLLGFQHYGFRHSFDIRHSAFVICAEIPSAPCASLGMTAWTLPVKSYPMDKATIADVLEKIATLLELKGENPFKIRAYTNAARSLETFGGSIADLTNEETLEKIPGIGKAIAAKIKELVETGSLQFFEDLRAEFP